MKKNLLLLFFAVLGFSVNSQTLELSYGSHSTLLNYGDTIVIDSLSIVTEMVASMNVKNTDTASHNVKCRKEYFDIVPGTENNFCWAGTCYPSTVFISPSERTIAPGETNTEFLTHYLPYNQAGVSLIKYTFIVFHGDSAWAYVKYTSTVGINDNKLSYSVSAPYPNPSNSEVNFNYNILTGTIATLQVQNIYGRIEKEFTLTGNSGILNVNVSDLSAGIYLYSLNINGRTVRTSKLIVTH